MQKGIWFKVNVSDELTNSSFYSDIGRIKQVLINLILNSCKFTSKGMITLNVEKEHAFSHNSFEIWNYLVFRVQDTGIGIDEKDIPLLFKLFSTLSSHNDLNSRGTGLGLPISKKIVESLGGTIRLKSRQHYGTWVMFTVKEKNSEL